VGYRAASRPTAKPADRLVGGFTRNVKTRANRRQLLAYASTLFDYIRRAMSFNSPQSLTADQVYAVSAYILYLNNIVTETPSSTPPRCRGWKCRMAAVLPVRTRDLTYPGDLKTGQPLGFDSVTRREI
jgi:hypothetical protein